MDNNKYVNYYVELLSSTLTDAVLRNVSLQTNDKISKEIIEELQKSVNTLKSEIIDLNNVQSKSQIDKDKLNAEQKSALENTIQVHQNTITDLKNEVSQFNNVKNDYENVKTQLTHVDKFRAELIKTQEIVKDKDRQIDNIVAEKDIQLQEYIRNKDIDIKLLQDQIEYLQLTPSQRKKIDSQKERLLVEDDNLIKDGGSF